MGEVKTIYGENLSASNEYEIDRYCVIGFQNDIYECTELFINGETQARILSRSVSTFS